MSTTAGCSSTRCPACPNGPRRRAWPRCSTCGATGPSRSAAARARCTTARSRPASSPTSPSPRPRASTPAPPPAWGWPEHALPGYIRSHVHPAELAPGQVVLLSTFRLPTQIHTRSANSKWLDELAHTNPVWVHPSDAARLGIARTGDLIRVETEIGYFVAKAWITEAIRPRLAASSHPMARLNPAPPDQAGPNQAGPTPAGPHP